MRKIFSVSPLVLCGLCLVGLYGCSANGLGSNLTGDPPVGQVKQPAQPTEHANGVVQDWSTHHALYPSIGEIGALTALQHDPRAILSWQAAEREYWNRRRAPRHLFGVQGAPQRDWSISLGSGTTAPNMYPAKYSFDVTAPPDCTNDFVVFPVNVATGVAGTQPNIVGFNDLYSGTTGGTGICNRAPSGSDTGVAAEVYWTYNVAAEDGQVSTSPALSLDGQKVALVETGSGTTAHFHVLAWAQFDGTNASNLQDVTQPVQITPSGIGFATSAPIEQSGSATDLALVPSSGTASDTLSSPFVDFAHDAAYVGNDSGTLFRVINVFCTPVCIDGGTEAPSLDPSWGTGGALATGCSGTLTGPIVDGGTGNIFVGCSDGKIYGFTSSGSPLANPSVTVGNGGATGGVVDPPMVDAVRHFVYGVAGSSSGGTAVMVQASSVDLSSPVISTIGAGGVHNIHSPSFNSAYFSSLTSSDWLLYDWAFNSAGTEIEIYAATFGAGHVMNSGAAANGFAVSGSSANELSPTTEFLNGSTDQLFVSGLSSNNPNFVEYNIASGSPLVNTFPTTFPPVDGSNAVGASTAEGSGSSGIIVDNDSGSAQASSIYIGVLVSNTAVKLTQSGLN